MVSFYSDPLILENVIAGNSKFNLDKGVKILYLI